VLSFILAGLGCVFAGLCYSEFASLIPIAGSAYTYGYATLGEIFAWIIGWDLILEYAFGAATVASGWAGYFVSFLQDFGISIPPQFTATPYTHVGHHWEPNMLVQFQGRWELLTTMEPLFKQQGIDASKLPHVQGMFNIVAFLIICLITFILVVGIKESANFNSAVVIIKVTIVLIFIAIAGMFVMQHSTVAAANWHPFIPPNEGTFGKYGWSGIARAAGVIFFAYIGFDAVSTAAQEAKNPQRDLPIGIIATLIVCTLLYISVAVVLTGIVPWQRLIDDAAPVVNSLKQLGITTGSHSLHWIRLVVLFGAMMGMISSLLVFQLGQARVWFAMSRDGLLPKLFGRVHPRFRTPSTATWIAGFLVGIPGGILDIGTLADLSNIGTLFAFVLVSLGVIILRYKQPERHRGFRAPLGLSAPVLSVLFCVLLMMGLPILTWIRFFVWLTIGLCVYMLYSRHRSEFSPANRGR